MKKAVTQWSVSIRIVGMPVDFSVPEHANRNTPVLDVGDDNDLLVLAFLFSGGEGCKIKLTEPLAECDELRGSYFFMASENQDAMIEQRLVNRFDPMIAQFGNAAAANDRANDRRNGSDFQR